LTETDQQIVDAIWGDDQYEVDSKVFDDIFAFADAIKNCEAQGKLVVVTGIETLH
tara:strand:- start:563 stop:727 length:165 start_codon:yes stop_codon:yes gene_type:complete